MAGLENPPGDPGEVIRWLPQPLRFSPRDCIIAPLLEPWFEGREDAFGLEDENRTRGSAPPNRRIALAGGGTVVALQGVRSTL